MAAEVTEQAAAKVNLFLHVLGRRSDGYHEIQSLVAFADIGDTVTVEPNADWALDIVGPFASHLVAEKTDDNLVMRAARRLAGERRPARIRLTKRLPVAAGIGGGSTDAAAAVRALARLWKVATGEPYTWVDLGADIPVCLLATTAFVKGIGEKLEPVSWLPPLPAVLVNPRVPTSTGMVFTALAEGKSSTGQDVTASDRQFDGAFPTATLPEGQEEPSVKTVATWLARTRNDLTRPAAAITPAIGEVLAALSDANDVLLARMSGSGATCFGLFPSVEAASLAAQQLAKRQPLWWVQTTMLGGASTT